MKGPWAGQGHLTLVNLRAWVNHKNRVPTQILFTNSLCFPCPSGSFPCAHLRNCNNFISETALKTKLKVSQQISKYPVSLELRSFLLEQTNSLCFAKIPKFPVFPLTENFLGTLTLFFLCSGDSQFVSSHMADAPPPPPFCTF